MQCTLLGTGTSHGIPVIACNCECCLSSDSKDKRLRTSLWVTEKTDGGKIKTSVLIDIGPDFRMQALRFGINKVDALLLTHGHADHLNGLDDIRIFSHTCSKEPPAKDGTQRVYPETKGKGLPVYGNATTLKDVHTRFDYIFKPVMEGGGKPKICTIDCSRYNLENPLQINSLSIIPVPMKHGAIDSTGYLIRKDNKSIAYLTDCSFISEESINLLHSAGGTICHLIIDGLRSRTHTTHLSFEEALVYAKKIGAKKTWLTHICHDMTHKQIKDYLSIRQSEAEPAYDGLVLTLNDAN